MWLAGGGFKGGYVHGETDEFGHKAVENVVNHYDYHATLLHLFGLDGTLSVSSAPAAPGAWLTASKHGSCQNCWPSDAAIRANPLFAGV